MSDHNLKTHSLGPSTPEELEFMKNNKVEFRKKFGQIQGKSKQDVKLSKCFYCGKECSSFCKSHSIPAFCLRHIAVDGLVYNNLKLIDFPLLDESKGVGNSGTFNLICNDCDSKIFSEYENPDNYLQIPSQKMLAQIVLKNYLKMISKRFQEKGIYNNLEDQFDINNEYIQSIADQDLIELIDGYNRAKKVLNQKKLFNEEYQLFYYKKLDYVVPIAFQSNIVPIFDLKDNVINNIYNESANYPMKSLHACIFPLENESIIMIIKDSRDKRFRDFRRQFNNLSETDKLAVLNFIVFAYSEDIFINQAVDIDVLTDSNLSSLAGSTPTITGYALNNSIGTNSFIEAAKQTFSLNNMKTIPNLLLEQHKVR